MKIGQIRKITFSTLRGGLGANGGFCEFDSHTTRKCRVVMGAFKQLKWQIVKRDKHQQDWDYYFRTDQHVLDLMELNEVTGDL